MKSGLDPSAVARELRAMWRAAGADSEDAPVMRAALMNFVVCAPGSASEVTGTVARVAGELPCRALVIETTPASGDAEPIEAWTSMHCRALGAGKQVCCEQVTLRVRSDALEALPSAILGLLLADLQTTLWAPACSTLDTPLLQRLAPTLDRIVFDTSAAPHPEIGLIRLDAFRTAGVDVADLAWGRLDAWRELFASFFDAPPHERSLGRVHDIQIEHGHAGRTAALLFAGWLVSRLDWDPDTAPIRFTDREEDGLLRVVAAAPGVRFIVEPDAAHPTMLVGRIESSAPGPRPQSLDRAPRDVDTELVGALQRTRRNIAFEAALDVAARLARRRQPPA